MNVVSLFKTCLLERKLRILKQEKMKSTRLFMPFRGAYLRKAALTFGLVSGSGVGAVPGAGGRLGPGAASRT